jgi:hypothetical protein
MWPGLRQYFEFWARQYFAQPDTTNLYATLFFGAVQSCFWVVYKLENQSFALNVPVGIHARV